MATHSPNPNPTDVEALYDAHRHACWNAAVHLLRDSAAAEDVLHDVFGRLLACGTVPDQPRAYLLKAVVHGARSWVRRRRRSPFVDEPHDDLPGSGPFDPSTTADPARFAIEGETRHAVANALATLPEPQREVVVLHGLEGLTFREVGELCGTSTNTAASRWRLACDALRTRLETFGANQP